MNVLSVSAEDNAAKVVAAILALPPTSYRKLIAIAGPPAAGKSKLAAFVQERLVLHGLPTGLLPMDGYHMDNERLEAMGLLARKGAPETFDLDAFARVVARLKTNDDVKIAIFDRAADATVPDAASITKAEQFVIIEGNYLLYDAPGWRDLSKFWDFSVFIAEPLSILQDRLVKRWLDHGLDNEAAQNRAESNDIPNAEAVLKARLTADMTIGTNANA